MHKIFSLLLLISAAYLPACSTEENVVLKPVDFKEVLLGRKDLIRNDLIKSVNESNNDLCKSLVTSQSKQTDALNNFIFFLIETNKRLDEENSQLKNQLKTISPPVK